VVSIAYMIAMVPLGLHIHHGLWSATQTLALRSARVQRIRRAAATGLAILIVLGNWSLPISVLAGIVKLEG
jgi:succinate dehydrogenase / fumarate reductase cytochrome b subunit